MSFESFVVEGARLQPVVRGSPGLARFFHLDQLPLESVGILD
jgi:hypothetical protein